MSIQIKGIDVSKHNGTIDWVKVSLSGIKFVIIRDGYGNSVGQKDSKFDYNITNALKNNLLVGIYHFSYATSIAEAEQEAQICNQIISKYKINIKLPVFFDWEYDSFNYYKKKKGVSPTNSLINQMNVAFSNKIGSLGYKKGLYFNNDYRKNVLTSSTINLGAKWLADYTNSPAISCTIQQYSDKGSVNGISGSVDLDYCYVDYGFTKSTDTSFTCDTTKDFRLVKGEEYTFKVTSANKPSITFGTSNVISLISKTSNENDYYFKVKAIGNFDTGTGVFVNGKKQFVINVVDCDTTANFKLSKNGEYTFKSCTNNVTSGNSSIIKIISCIVSNGCYLIKIKAIGKIGECAGIYLNKKSRFAVTIR